MNRLIFSTLILILAFAAGSGRAQDSPAPSGADVQTLRQEVQSLTETVKALQKQVEDQRAALEKANITGPVLPANPPAPGSDTAQGAPTPSRLATPAPLIPTEDSGVVANAPATTNKPASAGPGV